MMKAERQYPTFDDYVRLWKAILHPLLGWSDTRIEHWAQRFEKDFNRQDSEFHHDGPIMCVAYEFIPQMLKQPNYGYMISDFKWTIAPIIDDAVRGTPFDRLGQVDWEPVRKQIDDVLRSYGSSLEDVVVEKD